MEDEVSAGDFFSGFTAVAADVAAVVFAAGDFSSFVLAADDFFAPDDLSLFLDAAPDVGVSVDEVVSFDYNLRLPLFSFHA